MRGCSQAWCIVGSSQCLSGDGGVGFGGGRDILGAHGCPPAPSPVCHEGGEREGAHAAHRLHPQRYPLTSGSISRILLHLLHPRASSPTSLFISCILLHPLGINLLHPRASSPASPAPLCIICIPQASSPASSPASHMHLLHASCFLCIISHILVHPSCIFMHDLPCSNASSASLMHHLLHPLPIPPAPSCSIFCTPCAFPASLCLSCISHASSPFSCINSSIPPAAFVRPRASPASSCIFRSSYIPHASSTPPGYVSPSLVHPPSLAPFQGPSAALVRLCAPACPPDRSPTPRVRV